jgi:hypothetical protein
MAFTRGRYYQRSRRRNGRQWTEYWGRGCEAVAAEHAAERRAREEARQEARRRDEEQRAAALIEAGLARVLDGLLALELGAVGLARLDRGPWRRRPVVKALNQPQMTPEEREATVAEIRAAAKAAMAGEKDGLARLRAIGARYPATVIRETQANLGNVAARALMRDWIDKAEITPFLEGVMLRFETVSAALAGENPTPQRELCARRAAYCELECWLVSMEVAVARPPSPAMVARLLATEKRVMLAFKTLAQIERLERPRPRPLVAAQINIGVSPTSPLPDPDPGASLPDF